MTRCGWLEEALPLRRSGVGRTLVVSPTWTRGELRERTETGRIRAVGVGHPLEEDLEAIGPKVHAADDLLFPSATGLLLGLGNWRNRAWNGAAATTGVEGAPHDRRHACVSLLIHEGRSVPCVAAAPRRNVTKTYDEVATVRVLRSGS